MIVENVVAQLLRTKGDNIYYYKKVDKDTKKTVLEIDFLIRRNNKVIPVEVKSSSKGDKSVNIKHAQLFSLSQKVCLISVHVIEDNSGKSIEELINEIRIDSKICNNLQFELSLVKELKRVSPEEVKRKRFITKSIHFFLNSDINPFQILPENVSGLEYIIDLSETNGMSPDAIEEFLSL